MTVIRKGPIGYPLVQDELHCLDAALKMRVEVSGERGVRQLVLLLRMRFGILAKNRVSEDALMREESLDEVVPITKAIPVLGSL